MSDRANTMVAMTDQTPLAHFRADVRVQLLYAPDPRFKVDPELEVALTAENVLFGLPPTKGDRFIPGQLSQVLLRAGLTPVVDQVEHAPALPFSEDPSGYACVVINCSAPRVPTDTLLADLADEGWTVRDFRSLNGHHREDDDQ